MRVLAKVVPLCVAIAVALSLPLAAQSSPETGAAQQSTPAMAAGQNAANPTAVAAAPQSPAASTSAVPQTQQAPAQVSEPGPGRNEAQTSAPLRVMVGKSLLITTTDRLRRVSVTDPGIADALVVTPTQVLVHGRAPGEVSLILWDEQERSRSFDLRVDVDVTAAQQQINHLFPDEKITVEPSRNALVLAGHVATKEDAERVGAIAGAFSKNVVNVLTYGPVGAHEVLLEVKFASLDRLRATQLGLNIFSTGAASTIGTISTQQFGGFQPQQVRDIPFPPAQGLRNPTTGALERITSNQTINDPLNIFVYRPDIRLGAVLKALQQQNVLQILAEPNLIALNGKEASFLAGGEFPFPVVQPGTSGNAVTIQFKEFGVRLKFTPLIMPNGNIHLKVAPEVSALDFTNGLAVPGSGFFVPALSTRRAETELELQNGQSFVIAGLLDKRLTTLKNKIPGLGDIPILGYLFRSESKSKSTGELMVLVTAHRIQPSTTPPPLPNFPDKFLEPAGPAKPEGGAK
ncbi:MAG: type II and III secretion system protein family protein [Terriglobales bacterium]